MPKELFTERLKDELRKELDNFIVKDTYTKGKHAGIRKALATIEDINTDGTDAAIVAGKKLMKTLVFRGYSDDTFGEYGVTGDDVDTCASCKPVQCRIDSLSGSMLVVGQYSVTHPVGGCWVIGVSMTDEGKPLPDWPIRIKSGETPYTPDLEIDVPYDTELSWYVDGELVTAG